MKHDAIVRRIRADSAASTRRMRVLSFAAFVAAVIALIVFICMFIRAFGNLQKAIQRERIEYVEEISAQIITSRLFMERTYSETATNLANILEQEDIQSLDHLHEYTVSSGRDEILLLQENNRIVDLNGTHFSTPDAQLTQQLLGSAGVTQVFTSLNFSEDSWLFTAPIAPKKIDGVVYKAVILSVSASAFRDNMTISLLSDRGASYIIGNDGRIKIKPLSENLAFSGYNFFSGLLDRGASEEEVAALQEALKAGASGNTLIRAGQLDWLISHTAIDSETAIIVAIPLTLTAAQTYKGLSGTIMLSSLIVTAVALIAILLIIQFARRDRLREKEALAVAAKNEFFSKMSHDIRTPLNAVIGLSQLAQNDSSNPLVREYLAQSLSSAKYLLSIINDVLEVSRIESGKLAIDENPFDINVMLCDIKSVTAPLAAEKELTFTVETDCTFEREYIGDPVRIMQILTNLLSNATKFTKPGGHIELRIAKSSRPDGYDVLRIAVSDTGIGMSDKFLSRVFAPFEQEHSSYTQQYAGSGLGLSIVHELVRMMGGTIAVESRLDEGSTFTVELPLLRGKELSRATPPAEPTALSFVGRRILLAEDDRINQMVTERLLAQKYNIAADIASDGAIAVDMFHNAAPGTYDMILMDVKMPNMDGLAATRAIRALSRPDARTIPIVALSANAYKEDKDLSILAGMNDHLSKPLDIAALGAVFQRYFQ